MNNLEQLLIDMKESLEREIRGVKETLDDARVDIRAVSARFDTQSARLDRHAGLWQAGTRWSSRMDAWAEKVDSALESKDREIAELRERVLKLERKVA
jgi:hypothetical protein